MTLIYVVIILSMTTLIAILWAIIIYNRNYRFKTYGVIEVIPSRQKNDEKLVLKMESFIASLKSMPLIEGEYNVILDITNKDDLNTFRIISPQPYTGHIAGIVRNHFSDFEVSRLPDIEEKTFLDAYSGGFVFRTHSRYPMIRMEEPEKMTHTTKTIITSIKNGSFQIMLDFNTKPRSFITEEHLPDVQVGNMVASPNIDFVKDIAVSFRFLSFSKSPNTSLLPSAVGALFNIGGTSNFLTKIYADNSLIVKNVDGRSAMSNALYCLFNGKFPRLRNFSNGDKMYYSAREICSMYSLITDETIKCINYRRCNPSSVLRIQKELEAGKNSSEFTTISEIDYPGFEGIDLKLSPEVLRTHMYIVGKTGTGKSALLSNSMNSDIIQGRGFALFDPHGDLADKILDLIPENRKDDVVFIDPSNQLGRINLSIFSFFRELKKYYQHHQYALFEESQKSGESMCKYSEIDITEHLMKEITLVLKNVSVGGSAHWGARMDSIISNIGAEILRYNMGEIKDMSSCLNSPSFRKNIIGNISNESIKEEMTNFEKMDKKTQEESFQSVRNRFQIFLSESMKDIFSGDPEISIKDILENNKIVIFRLSKSELGPTAGLLGILMLNVFWKFAQARSNMPENTRKDFTIYLDEAQNFITDDIASILEEARKYRLRLVMATQYSKQLFDINPHVYNSLIGNIGTFIALGVGHDDAAILGKYFNIDPLDMQKIPALHGYVKCNYYSSDTFNIKLKFVEKNPNLSYPGRIALMNLSHEKYGLKETDSPSLRTYFEKFEKLPSYRLTKASYEIEVREMERKLGTHLS